MQQGVGADVAEGRRVGQLAGADAVEHADEGLAHGVAPSPDVASPLGCRLGRERLLSARLRLAFRRRLGRRPAPPRPGVGGEVGLAQVLDRHVGVDLRRGHVGVAEHLLHAAQVGAGREQVGGERVTEAVRTHVAVERRALDVAPHEVVQPLPREGGAARVHEELVAAAPPQERAAAAANVAAHGGRRVAADGHHPLLVALADTTQEAGLEIDVGEAQGHELGGAQAAAVQELYESQVTLAQIARPGGARDERLDLVDREHLGERLRTLRRLDAGRGVARDPSLAHEEATEAAHRGQSPRDAARRPVAARSVEVGAYIGLAAGHRLQPPGRQESHERSQVAPIRCDGVRAQSALELEVLQVVDQCGGGALHGSVSEAGGAGNAHEGADDLVRLFETLDRQVLVVRVHLLHAHAQVHAG